MKFKSLLPCVQCGVHELPDSDGKLLVRHYITINEDCQYGNVLLVYRETSDSGLSDIGTQHNTLLYN